MSIYKKDPRLCDFNRVELSIPRLKLLKLYFKRSYLTIEETIFLKALLWKTELTQNKIMHVRSIVDKTLLKSTNSRP